MFKRRVSGSAAMLAVTRAACSGGREKRSYSVELPNVSYDPARELYQGFRLHDIENASIAAPTLGQTIFIRPRLSKSFHQHGASSHEHSD